jgi:tetratricopeptide (TPR) repeat protein
MRELLSQAAEARRRGELDQSRTHLNAALEAAGDDPLARGIVLRELGELARNRQAPTEAVSFYQRAVALLRQAEADKFLLAHTIRHLGDVYMDAGQTELAEPALREAVALYHSEPGAGELDVANALRSLAVWSETDGAPEEARSLWLDVRSRYAELGIDAGVEESTRRLARLDALGRSDAGAKE